MCLKLFQPSYNVCTETTLNPKNIIKFRTILVNFVLKIVTLMNNKLCDTGLFFLMFLRINTTFVLDLHTTLSLTFWTSVRRDAHFLNVLLPLNDITIYITAFYCTCKATSTTDCHIYWKLEITTGEGNCR